VRRILLVTTSYPEKNDGAAAAGVFIRDFAHTLARLGIQVDVVTPSMANSQVREDAVTVTRFAVPRLPLSLLRPARPGDWPAILTTLRAGQRAVLDACQRTQPDHILALWALPSGAWARNAAKRMVLPYSVWALGSDIWTLSRIPVLRRYLARVLAQASHRFADGLRLGEDVQHLCARPCVFLPSSRQFGKPGGRLRSTAPPYRLAFLGRWHENKGVDLLLSALARLDAQTWSRIAGVRLFGGGPMEAMVRQDVALLAAAGRPVEIGGYLDLTGARALFEWTDYVVIPSRIESIPVVFSDAMQAGRPVIATPVGDLGSLVSETGCGCLAERADANAIAEAIARAVNLDSGVYDDALTYMARQFDLGETTANFLTLLSPGARNTTDSEPMARSNHSHTEP
jgi:glycosyltransferase involved in cell wall biosynthesis